MLELRLLGPLEIRDGAQSLSVPRRKPRALLAVLALNAGRVVSRDRLVDDLWGQSAPRTAAHALENYVSQLRKLLGADVVQTQAPGYVLRLEPDRVDALRFERLVREAGAEQLREALSLLRGTPLEDVADAPFAAAEIRRLEELELSARESLLEAEPPGAAAVAELERLIGRHPYRERLRGLMMLALYRSGRQADALAAYRAARATLAEELGIEPGAELQGLERAILRQDPALSGPAAEAPAAGRRPAAGRAGRKTVTAAVVRLRTGATDPEALQSVVASLRTVAERHGGTVQGGGGSPVTCVFGVPTVHEDDALRAVRAAVEIRDLRPDAGTGIGTGEVYVDPERVVTGDPLDRARALALEAAAGEIVLAPETIALVGDAASLDGVRVVGLRPDAGRTLRLDSPLVGRRRQLQALESAFAAAVSDETCHLFTVLGPAGVGKSRLVRELAGGLGDGAALLRGRCLPYGEGVTFRPLAEALAAAGLEADPAEARAAFEALARRKPLVIVFDDLHWAEPAFLDLVETVAESRGAPILLVCLARPELLDVRPGWAGGRVNATTLLLEPLGEDESGRLIDNLLGPSDLPEIVRDWIVSTAEGNPLFVEEMLASLVDQGVLRPRGDGWTTVEMPALAVPPSVQALIAARIDRLRDEERTVLELASIEGRRFRPEALAALAQDELQVGEQLAALVRKELVRPRQGEHSFAFRHQLVRDAAYDSMPKRLRADLHERFADWLRSHGEAELVAYHREQAMALRRELDVSRP